MRVLGISAYYHDSAAAIIEDGVIKAAAQEERFTRKKHDLSFPQNAIQYCLQEARIHIDEVDSIAFYDKPFIKFERLLETYLAYAPRGFRSFKTAMPIWLSEKLFQKRELLKNLKHLSPSSNLEERLLFSEHHLSHAASAFYPSPFEEALILTMDGVGEWATTSLCRGYKNTIEVFKEIHFPHSLGLLYSAFTYFTGFKVNSGEYKVMGLAPYGQPKYAKIIYDRLIDIKPDGSFRLNQEYFDYCTGLKMTNKAFENLFKIRARDSKEKLTQIHMDLAASVQVVLEDVVIRLAKAARAETGIRNLCLAGGVALNCVANGKLLRTRAFDKLWIQPAAGDAGGALGAALAAYHLHAKKPRIVTNKLDSMSGSYLGPEFSDFEIERDLKNSRANFRKVSDNQLFTQCAQAMADGKACGWFQGRMEFGPRSLGNRSILADARSPKMQSILNLKVKYRESFRPFAPAVLAEDVSHWFDLKEESPYMLLVADILEKRRRQMSMEENQLFGIDKLNIVRSEIPAVTHVDYSARIQTVHQETNPRFHMLLSTFKAKTGCPVLVNTSFNVRGEPIVCTPLDAFRCFMGTEIEILALGNYLLFKEEQDPELKLNYKDYFELD